MGKLGSMLSTTLLPDPKVVRLDHFVAQGDTITLCLSTIRPAALCPDCGRTSDRVHSRYHRSVADLAWQGLRARILLWTRRWFCENPNCSRAIFTERLPGVVARYARRTERSQVLLGWIAHALGGEAGARLACQCVHPVSGDTLLRQLAAPPAPPQAPRVLGVDDWAFRRNVTYGTVLIDLEQGAVIDLLPDRRAETLAQWLRDHPGTETVSRDRGGNYAEGIRQGAPAAVQVADRWHLLRNLIEALEAEVAQRPAALNAAAQMGTPEEAGDTASELPEDPFGGDAGAIPGPPRTPEPAQRPSPRRQAAFDVVQRLHQDGRSERAIARETGKSRNTVRKYLQVGQLPPRRERAKRGSALTPFRHYLAERWKAGCHNGAQLWREIREQGFGGTCFAVQNFVAPWRAQLPPDQRRTCGPSPQRRRTVLPPAPRTVVWWLVKPEDQLTAHQATLVQRLCQHAPELAEAQRLVREFFQIARERQGTRLTEWVQQVASTAFSELKRFCRGLRRDWDAVVAGLTLEWSNGPTEGHVNRLKLVKRQMYGRAGFELLRARVLPLTVPG